MQIQGESASNVGQNFYFLEETSLRVLLDRKILLGEIDLKILCMALKAVY